MADSKTILDEAQEKMDMAVMYLDEALAHIRAGKADIRLLDGIRVDSYGSMVPINNVASVNTPDARSIAIKPWDKNMFRVIEKAIIDSELGIMPENNGEIIRIGIPPLTEERRKQLAKQCKAECETAKVSVRNARRDAIDALKKALEHEMLITASINAIYAAAYEVRDFRTMQMLDWFIKEQGEEEKNAADLITKMDLFGGDSKGLYMLNSELKARVYTAPSLVL